jgi:transposase-like protein
MSMAMEDEIKRWTAKRKSALVLDTIQGKTTVAEASRAYDLPPSEIEKSIDQGKRGMENVLRANPQDAKEQYEQQLKELQEAMERRCLSSVRENSCSPCWARTSHDRDDPPGTALTCWASTRTRCSGFPADAVASENPAGGLSSAATRSSLDRFNAE